MPNDLTLNKIKVNSLFVKGYKGFLPREDRSGRPPK